MLWKLRKEHNSFFFIFFMQLEKPDIHVIIEKRHKILSPVEIETASFYCVAAHNHNNIYVH